MEENVLELFILLFKVQVKFIIGDLGCVFIYVGKVMCIQSRLIKLYKGGVLLLWEIYIFVSIFLIDFI